jgi:hypothetical protein
MKLPADVAKAVPMPDFSKFKMLPRRTDIVYRDNAGYDLTINHLPWGNKSYSVKRYRISNTENLQLVEDREDAGESLKISSPLAPDAVEFIELRAH